MRSNIARARGFSLLELMIIVAITGVLCAVAIPSYMNYARRAETAEAPMNIRIMYDGAVAYYISDHATAAGSSLDHRFPASIGPTPAVVPPATKVWVPSASWDVPEWTALNFAPHDAIRFSYSFVSNGAVGVGALANMVAQGDLNGNGVNSLFSRSCTGTGEGVEGGSALLIVNEIE